MKCVITHTGQNFSKSFGPFDSHDDAIRWLLEPRVRDAGVRGMILPLIPPTIDMADVWNIDVWDEEDE